MFVFFWVRDQCPRQHTSLWKWYPRPNRRNIHPISDQNGKLYTLFQTRNARKWYPLGRHIPIWLIYESPPPPPPPPPIPYSGEDFFVLTRKLNGDALDKCSHMSWRRYQIPRIFNIFRSANWGTFQNCMAFAVQMKAVAVLMFFRVFIQDIKTTRYHIHRFAPSHKQLATWTPFARNIQTGDVMPPADLSVSQLAVPFQCSLFRFTVGCSISVFAVPFHVTLFCFNIGS